MPEYFIENTNCISHLAQLKNKYDIIFADPPDNIGLAYGAYNDKMEYGEYIDNLYCWMNLCSSSSKIFWLSFNSIYTLEVAKIVNLIQEANDSKKFKPFVQFFRFGNYSESDFYNCYRPLYRISNADIRFYPERIRIKSFRQIVYNDKRAIGKGKVPCDVFEIPRVTGNSKQRRPWHPTQLHEDLIEACILSSAEKNFSICDAFAGTGTTLRVVKKINQNHNLNLSCTLLDIDKEYCEKIVKEHADIKFI